MPVQAPPAVASKNTTFVGIQATGPDSQQTDAAQLNGLLKTMRMLNQQLRQAGLPVTANLSEDKLKEPNYADVIKQLIEQALAAIAKGQAGPAKPQAGKPIDGIGGGRNTGSTTTLVMHTTQTHQGHGQTGGGTPNPFARAAVLPQDNQLPHNTVIPGGFMAIT